MDIDDDIVIVILQKRIEVLDMCIDDIKNRIEKIESKLGNLVDIKLRFIDASKEQYLVVAIVNDCIDLIEDVQRNIYAFYVSYKNSNNTISFNPNYYFENIILQDDMIWERLILLVGIIDQLDVSIIFSRKSIEPLYDLIKKHRTTEDDIIVDLRSIKGNYNSKKIKWKRNNNEHFISTHLECMEIEEDLKKLFYVSNNQLRINMDECDYITNKMHEVSMDELNKWIQSIKKKQDIYIRLMEKIIIELSEKNMNCQFNCAERLICEYAICTRNFVCESALLEDRYEKLREEYRNVINKINEYCIDLGDEASSIRYNLLIDAIFRAKEMIRSVNVYISCLNYHINGNKTFAFSESDFKKYIDNEVITPECYYFHASVKAYSVCEKIAKFILCKYDFRQEYTSIDNFKNMYIDDILEKINNMNLFSECINIFNRIMKGEVYAHYEKIRNLEYHCLRQEYLDISKMEDIKLGKMYEVFMLLNQLYELFEVLVDEERELLYKRIAKQ